jgi:hypothetical protein
MDASHTVHTIARATVGATLCLCLRTLTSPTDRQHKHIGGYPNTRLRSEGGTSFPRGENLTAFYCTVRMHAYKSMFECSMYLQYKLLSTYSTYYSKIYIYIRKFVPTYICTLHRVCSTFLAMPNPENDTFRIVLESTIL